VIDMRWFRPPPVASSRPQHRGGRSSILAAALCALAAAWWLSGTRRDPGEGAAASPPSGDTLGGVERELASIEEHPEESSGRGRSRAASDLPEPASTAAPGDDGQIDLHGRVLAGGLPVAEREIELVPLAGTLARSAWDLTDEEGHYSVQVPAGRYAVLLDGVLAPGACLEVPAGALQVRSDVTLASVPPAD
jgi:hypothetical protein